MLVPTAETSQACTAFTLTYSVPRRESSYVRNLMTLTGRPWSSIQKVQELLIHDNTLVILVE